MIVGIARIHIRIEAAQSLKDKRQVLRSSLDKVRRMGIAASEVSDQDLWNRSTIGLSCVSNQAAHALSIIQHAVNHFDELPSVEVEGVETDAIRFGEE